MKGRIIIGILALLILAENAIFAKTPCGLKDSGDILRGFALGSQKNQTDVTSDCFLSVNSATI